MAELARIEELDEKLGGIEPQWLVDSKLRSGMHLSGHLRETAEQIEVNELGSLDDIADELAKLLFEVAEVLDDAHQEWLEMKAAELDARIEGFDFTDAIETAPGESVIDSVNAAREGS